MSWFAMGQLVSLVALAWLGHVSFGMPVWQSVIAVALSFLLALVACRVTGETDTTPVGAMGKVTQLTFGALSPGNVNVNLMSANITAGAATSAADLLGDLKSGYLLGAHPRQQFLAQFAGIFIGTLVTVLTFAALVPNAQVLGTDQFPAPAAQTWSAVAIALGKGLSALEPVKLWLILAGGVVGVLLTLAPVLLPKYRDYLPSAAAFGLAWVFHWYYGLLVLPGRPDCVRPGEAEAKACRGVHFSRGLGRGGRRFADGCCCWCSGPTLAAFSPISCATNMHFAQPVSSAECRFRTWWDHSHPSEPAILIDDA